MYQTIDNQSNTTQHNNTTMREQHTQHTQHTTHDNQSHTQQHTSIQKDLQANAHKSII